MSEVGFGSHAVDDIWAGLDLSRCILADLNTMQANAWVYWQVKLVPEASVFPRITDQNALDIG